MSLETEHSGLISNCSDGGKSLGKVTGLLTTEVESLCNCTWKPNEQGEGLKQSEVSHVLCISIFRHFTFVDMSGSRGVFFLFPFTMSQSSVMIWCCVEQADWAQMKDSGWTEFNNSFITEETAKNTCIQTLKALNKQDTRQSSRHWAEGDTNNMESEQRGNTQGTRLYII